jgi:uncharacterized protein YjiS (DUF1127 family)
MSTIPVVQTAVSNRQIAGFIKGCWNVFQERRERQKVRAALYGLNVCDLKDIGIAHGEIEYVASNRSVDPRGVLAPLR